MLLEHGWLEAARWLVPSAVAHNTSRTRPRHVRQAAEWVVPRRGHAAHNESASSVGGGGSVGGAVGAGGSSHGPRVPFLQTLPHLLSRPIDPFARPSDIAGGDDGAASRARHALLLRGFLRRLLGAAPRRYV